MTTLAFVRTGIALVVLAAAGAAPCFAQTRVASLEELRRQLATGDVITVIPAAGQPVKGRLVRLGQDDLGIRPGKDSPDRGRRDVTIRFDAIQSLQRPRDPARNGAVRGAAIGAGFAGALFVYALAVDRNEIDEWAPMYAGLAGVTTGIGALVGWAVDAARSKPGLSFDKAQAGRTTVSVRPMLRRGRGIALAVSVSR
jgi:HAMP domain-containing protein